MLEWLNLIGALTAHVIFISSIITFSSRMIFKIGPGHWVGIPLLLMVFLLGYLLFTAPRVNRPFLFDIQAGLMLLFIILLYLVVYVYQYNFRQTQWMVISFVIFYFAGMGGMIGIASLAGRIWTISSVIFFHCCCNTCLCTESPHRYLIQNIGSCNRNQPTLQNVSLERTPREVRIRIEVALWGGSARSC
jgi:hypothetical protein